MSSFAGAREEVGSRRQAHQRITGIAASVLLALLLVLLAAALGGGLAVYFGDNVDLAANQAMVLDKWRGALLPEPVERAAYLAAVLAAFPASLLAVKVLGTRDYSNRAQTIALAAICTASTLIAYFGISSAFLQNVFDGRVFPVRNPAEAAQPPTLLAAGLCSIAFMAAAIHGRKFPAWAQRAVSAALLAALVLFILFTLATRLRTPDMLYGDLHFEAVYYTVTQVAAGKTLLADLPAQYGLYAEIIAPVTHLTGVSVAGFTLFLAILQSISVVCVFLIVSVTIRSDPMRLLALFAVALLFGSTWIFMRQSTSGYEYFQIWPIRTFFPALLTVWLIFWIRRAGGQRELSILSAVCGLGIAWNYDWGIVTYGAALAYFLMRAITSQGEARKANVKFLAIAAMVPLAVLGAFLLYLAVKSGFQTRPQDWAKYQSIFYQSGFGMLPLRRTESAWQITLLIYLTGMIYPIAAHFRGRQDVQSDAVFLLSITGIGIFTYFQGRSHEIVLSFVVWPALIIAFILADKAIAAVRQSIVRPLYGWAGLPIVLLGFMSAIVLVKTMPKLIDNVSASVRALVSAPPGKASANIAFVQEKARAGGAVAIYSSGQAILFGETGLASSVKGPGTAETILRQDLQAFIASLSANPSEHVFIDAAKDGSLPPEFSALTGTYDIIDHSPAGLIYLVPKSAAK